MHNANRVFAFDIGWKFHGWAIKQPDNNIDAGVYAFEHDTVREEYVKLKRDKRRKQSRNRRLRELKKRFVKLGLFANTKAFETFLRKNSHQNNLWKTVETAHDNPITPEQFSAILYRFAKRRHYVDMRKKLSFEKSKTDKEKSDMKKSWSAMGEIYHTLPESSTWFEALFARRKKLIQLLKEAGVAFDEERFPYTNRKWNKFIDKEKYSALLKKKAITGYDLMLRNEQVAESLAQLAQKQRALGNNHPIFSDELMEQYIKLITFKGLQQSFADKIGVCLSGEELKRHPISSIDAEKSKIASTLHLLMNEIDKDGKVIREFKLSDTGLDFENLEKILTKLISAKNANKKGDIVASKLITALRTNGYLPKKKDFIFKNFKHKEKPNSTIVLRLPGHLRMLTLSPGLREILLKDNELRDEIEFTMLSFKDPDTLKERLSAIFSSGQIEAEEKDLDLLALSDTGKPAACHNQTYRKILPLMAEGADFTTALTQAYPNALTNQKRYFRKTLDYKIYHRDQQRKGINSPYQDTIIKEFIFLFNRLVQKYGEPDRIVFETTRAILSEKAKKEIEDKINDNEKLNREIDTVLNSFVSQYGVKPAKGVRERLKLFVAQGGKLLADKNGNRQDAKCILTGKPISLEAAIEGDRTNTDHIIPRSWIHDNRLDNKMLLDKSINQSAKEDMTPIQYLISIGHTEDSAKTRLTEYINGMKLSKTKKRHIFETREKEIIKQDAENRIHSMDQRMKGEQDHAVKAIMSLLVDQLRFNTEKQLTVSQYRSRVLPINGSMTNLFRRGWLPDYKKERARFHNHAVDALVMLNFDRSMLQHYVKLLQESYLRDKDKIEIAKKKIVPTIENFVSRTMEIVNDFEMQKRVVVRREIKKYRGRLYEQTAYPKGEQKSAVNVKGHFRKLESGFQKLLLYTNPKGKIQAVRIHPGNMQHTELAESFFDTLYRYSLIRIKSKLYCGYCYVIGYTESTGRLELTPANHSSDKRIRPTFSSLKEYAHIQKLSIAGVVTAPNCT